MQENNIISLIYTFFLGLLIAVFIGVGINTFYEGPVEPDYRTVVGNAESKDDAEAKKQQAAYDQVQSDYMDKVEVYSRNVSVVVLLIAVVLVAVSLHYDKKSSVIANGVMLGGLFTLVYGIIRSFMSGDSKFIFAAATVGLGLVLYLGYRRFSVSAHPAKK